jgi:hypothetical protein
VCAWVVMERIFKRVNQSHVCSRQKSELLDGNNTTKNAEREKGKENFIDFFLFFHSTLYSQSHEQ